MFFQIARVSWLAVLVSSCGTSPLDAVIAEDSGVNGGSDAGVCSEPAVGRFALRSLANGLCLGNGDPTTVFGSPGFTTAFAADCALPAQSWDLSASGAPGVYALKNVVSGDTLDVKMAAVQSGTPVITYGATGLGNQQFQFRARGAASFELRPQHAPTTCVAAVGASAEITTCVSTDTTQSWQLVRSDCL